MKPRAVVFGGTFDPVHNGHIVVAEQVRDLTAAGAVWFVPALQPPLRERTHATLPDRLALLRAAITSHDGLAIADIEMSRGGISFTADTMEQLHHEHPDAELAVLLGADAARSIRAWHRAGDLLAHERFIVVNRSGTDPLDHHEATALGFDPERTTLLEIASPPISASEVRRRTARGLPIGDLVPPAVAELISTLGLYQTSDRSVHNASG